MENNYKILTIFLWVLFFSYNSTVAQKSAQMEEFMSNTIDVVLLSESNLDLGEFYPDTKEQILNKRIEFQVEGQVDKVFNWDINNITESSVKLKMKFFGSTDGINWTEINKLGTSFLNKFGLFYIRIDIQQLEVPAGAYEGNNDSMITVSVSY
jgi:hypothetical protein